MLTETNRIDFIAQSPTGEIALVITAAEDWSTDEHALELLSEKIDTYVSYMKDPRFKEEYESATAYIEVVAMCEPTPQVQELLDAASAATGVRIVVQKMEMDIEGLLGGAPDDLEGEQTPSRRSSPETTPSSTSAPAGLLGELMAAARLDFFEIEAERLAVSLEGERVGNNVVQAWEVDEELAIFAAPIPEPVCTEYEAVLESVLRTSFTAHYVKALSGEEGQLMWVVELPSAWLTPAVVNGVVRGLGYLADTTREDCADGDANRARLLECMMAQAANITVDVASAEPEIRAELEAAGLATKQEFEDAVLTYFAKVGDMEIDLLVRFHEHAISFIIYLPGLQPRGDKEEYLEYLLELNARAEVAKVGIDNDGDLAILYEIPGFSPGMFQEVANQLKMLFQGVLEVHARA